MSGAMLTISDLLRDAADALEEAYRGRDSAGVTCIDCGAAGARRAHHVRKYRPGRAGADDGKRYSRRTVARPLQLPSGSWPRTYVVRHSLSHAAV
jgi:hypothetical protein